MGDFGQWLRAFGGQAWTYVGEAFTVIALLELLAKKTRWKDKHLLDSWPYVLAVGVLMFVWGSYSSWDVQHRAFENEHKKLAALEANPKFNGGIKGMAHVFNGPIPPRVFAVLANAWIENDGAASAVEDWVAEARDQSTHKMVAGYFVPPPSRIWYFPDAKRPWIGNAYTPENSLYNQTLNPLRTYDHKYGAIMVFFDRPVDVFSLTIKAEDRHRTWYPIRYERRS